MQDKPEFSKLKSFQEFNTYYWYYQELVTICKSLQLQYKGTKQELNQVIEAYFRGERIVQQPSKKCPNITQKEIELSTPLLACQFAFNQKFREFLAQATGQTTFTFTADMAATWRKVKQTQDRSFTLGDLLAIYKGEPNYAYYDHKVCQWNQFYKEFCKDAQNVAIKDKMKKAAWLWQQVKQSKAENVYSAQLRQQYAMALEDEKSRNMSC